MVKRGSVSNLLLADIEKEGASEKQKKEVQTVDKLN